jgi:hypothetical protein
MTPEQWFAALEPAPLLTLVGSYPAYWEAEAARRMSPATRRQLRLFAVACARMVWDILPTDARSAVLISERFAEGRASESDLRAAGVRLPEVPITFAQHATSAAAWASLTNRDRPEAIARRIAIDALWNPIEAARSAAKAVAGRAAGPAPPPGRTPAIRDWHTTWNSTFLAARATQAAFVRDIFPPPAYTPRLARDWLTSTVVALARGMDAIGDFSATPILADALQDAGCDDETVLQCCRVAGNVHIRGNWVVDLVLGRSS